MAEGPNENIQYDITSEPAGEKVANSQLFNVIVTLDNHSSEKYNLPTNNIIELAVEEDLLSWPYKGYIIYANRYEGIERNIDPEAWFYRMDARDEINIKIKAIADDPTSKDFPADIWEMDLDLVVYDTEDLISTNITTKKKKIYFWDKRYQMMMDKKIHWSTVTAQKLKNASHLTDDKRSMLTGDAIKDLITSKDAGGYEDQIDTDNWDIGSTKLMYTSPTKNSISDDIKHLMGTHLSETHDDMVVMKYNNRLEKKWQLIPLHKFFDNAGNEATVPGKWQLEHFFFEDIESEAGITSPYRAPYRNPKNEDDPLQFEIDIKMVEWGKISTYQFTDMAGIDNTKALVSKPVYYYCFGSGVFGMDYEKNEIESVKKDFKKLYTDKLLSDGESVPIFTLNNTKTNQVNVEPEFDFVRNANFETAKSRLVSGRGKILFGGVFLNEFIKFRVVGSPHRTVGKFIGIDRKTTDDTLNFDNKICGQWFVTDVKHVWNHNRYVNDICAVKVNMYTDNGLSEDVD